MSTEIIKVLDDLSKRFGVAIDWTDKNVMPYLQDLYVRYIRYRMCGAVLWLVVGIILLIIGVKCFIWLKKYYDDDKRYDSTSEMDGFALFCGITTLCISVPMILWNVNSIILCATLPEKMIIEELVHLMQ